MYRRDQPVTIPSEQESHCTGFYRGPTRKCVPNRTPKCCNRDKWERVYAPWIDVMFDIVKIKLHNECDIDIENEHNYRKFIDMIYNNSSKHISEYV